jgi:putative resolvase
MPVPVRRLDSGTIWVDAAPSAMAAEGRTVVYARVSSHEQRADVDRQVARLAQWGTQNGHAVAQVLCEVGTGLNGKRPKLRRILSDPSAMVVLVEHRDRLARFGVEYVEAALGAQGRRVVVADPGVTADDLVRDMIEVVGVDVRTTVWPARRPPPGNASAYRGAAGAQ